MTYFNTKKISMKKKLGLVSGCFDPLHEGHIEYFKQSYKITKNLICSIDENKYSKNKNGIQNLTTTKTKLNIIKSIKYIKKAFINKKTTADVLEELKPNYFFKDIKWKNKLPLLEKQICKKYNVEIVYLNTKLNSSTSIKKKFLMENKHFNTSNILEKFNSFYLSQKGANPNKFTENYYQGSWRTEDKYTLESRRKIEGKNPFLIKKILKPKTVCDFGSGPGFLMFFLYELGIKVNGYESSKKAIKLAPNKIKKKIINKSISKKISGKNKYDLVICRETFEHMKAYEVFIAVENMCRLTKKFIYVTTRFHPNPKNIFDITTEFNVDPTHINLMTKSLLRLFFILNKFKRRKDLEKKMDWLNKKRVLVYEKCK